jgi:hypothetical protein
MDRPDLGPCVARGQFANRIQSRHELVALAIYNLQPDELGYLGHCTLLLIRRRYTNIRQGYRITKSDSVEQNQTSEPGAFVTGPKCDRLNPAGTAR